MITGKIAALKVNLYSNGGHSADLSYEVSQCVIHSTYYLDSHFQVTCNVINQFIHTTINVHVISHCTLHVCHMLPG